MKEYWINRARLTAGLVLFTYVSLHLINLSLGLVSIAAMDAMLAVVILFWGHWSVQAVLLTSLLTHFGLALRALFRRRTLRMPKRECAQLVLGFLIPFMLVLHVSKTRVAADAYHAHITYAYELLQFWVRDPWAGLEQVTLLVVCWTHACIGLHFVMRFRGWYGWAKPYLLIAAFWVPFLGFLGFLRAGAVVRGLAQDPAWIAAIDHDVGLNAAHKAEILWIAFGLRMAVLALLIGVLAARVVRRWLVHRRGMVTLTFAHGKRLKIARGTSVLEASRDAGIPHASICGGRGRCSTCRTHVSPAGLPSASPFELGVLERMHLPASVRLACQFRPQCDVTVTPILSLADAQRGNLHGTQQGVEREIAVMFCDLRGFTELSEHRLPYDVVFLLNRYFAAMGEAITTSGGHIDKFIGDGIMALFGMDCDPVSGSRQALAAAARMSARVDQLNQAFAHELPRRLKIGIGVHSGMVVLGEMGWGTTRGLTAIGDCVNTASRLEALSKTYDAELIVSEDVERFSGLDLTPWDAHEVVVRGRTTPLHIRAFTRARELESAVALRQIA
ncbi:MAG: adenylate/guanylate cyclase domain-containing protein [Sphingomonadales bacterium]|nr:adenylate/guanylate cyclase domain-containing protein [Sphingomonadales bacterium]